jgi:endonuclease/exonuclease/phosphatase family metal-dependent hydrolase
MPASRMLANRRAAIFARFVMRLWPLAHCTPSATLADLKITVASLVLLVTGLVASTAPAALLLDEPFAYADGPLVTASAGAWTTHSGTTSQAAVVSGRAFISDTNGEDVNRLLSQSFAPASGATLYARFTLTCDKLPSTSGDYFAHFKSSSDTTFRAKLFALTQGAAPGTFRLGIANISNAPNAVLALDLATNVPHIVVLRYVVSNATTTLWVNPGAEADPSVTDTNPTTTITVVAFALRQTGGLGSHYLDDLVVGTNFADVAAFVPPTVTTHPASATVNSGANVNFTVAATGTFPLSYQWQFNGSPIPGATNTTLTRTNVSLADAGAYWATVTNPVGSTNSDPAVLTVNPVTAAASFSLVHYNLKGNFTSDWTTNAPQVQAIARKLQYLNPDIITLNEIPNSLRHEMTNWMTAFFPDYQLAISPGTDGAIRNGVITRYSIITSNSLLTRIGLTNFGYEGVFTRDLFEAQLAVPGFPTPFHVFVTHLKSGQTTDDSSRRAAEANAISNYLVAGFLTTNGNRPYVLTGDMNEDIARPPSGSQQPLQRLISTPTGLRLTTPLNPVTSSELTFSIQSPGGLARRYDYVLPCGLLFSNVTTSQIFRTDVLTPPPPPLTTNDSATASDHLPVVLVFNHPYDQPFHILSASAGNGTVTLTWESVSNRIYGIEASTNLTTPWTVLATNLTATGTNTTFTTNAVAAPRFLRVYRAP